MAGPHRRPAQRRVGSARAPVRSGAHRPAAHAAEVAPALDVEPASVRVLGPHVGGGFGGKAFVWSPVLFAAAAARRLGRPVKIAVTREQLHTVTGHGAELTQTITLGAARDGTLGAVRFDAISEHESEDPGNRAILNFYRMPNIHVGLRSMSLDLPQQTIMRAPGDEAGSFAYACAMDELAGRLGLDPVDLRLRNYLTTSLKDGLPVSSKHLDECYRVGAREFGWAARHRTPGSVRDGDWFVGVGMATGVFGADLERRPRGDRFRRHGDRDRGGPRHGGDRADRQRQPRRLPDPGQRRHPGHRRAVPRPPGPERLRRRRPRSRRARHHRVGGRDRQRRPTRHRHPRPRPADHARQAAPVNELASESLVQGELASGHWYGAAHPRSRDSILAMFRSPHSPSGSSAVLSEAP
ncbi:MAG: molybdopterin-dependent oxidoreductase [Actinophytocola sp.]|nr:molybdopterin-dependent oxidoreductase [Actinophytocola sp.]